MECPACRKPMVIIEFNRVELDFCPACQGCWMDRGELGLLLHGQQDLPGDFDLDGEAKSQRRCPRCRKRMRVGLLPGTAIEVDVCARDGIWLDSGEAQAVALQKADLAHGATFIHFISSVLGGAKRNRESEDD
jgi:Zn-finger nucleic acid-binding protein